MRRYSPESEFISHAPQTNHDPTIPSNNKITISFPTQLNHYDDDDPTTPIPIYLHAPTKKSVKIVLAAKISVSDIKKVVEEMIGIKIDHQLLYLNGKNVTEYGFIRLQAHNIIHILCTDQICSNQHTLDIKVSFVNFASQEQNKIIKNYKIAANQFVSNFIKQIKSDISSQLPINSVPFQFYLLESSRILESDKSFAQQEVGRSTDIVCLITQHQIKTRFTNDTKEQILHDISELLGFGEEVETKQAAKPQEKPTISRYPAYRESQRQQKQKRQTTPIQETSQSRGINDSSTEWNASVSLPNFKKKTDPLSKSIQYQHSPTPLAKKLRASKKKKDLDFLLNSQEKQKFIFQSPQVIKEEVKEQKQEEIKQTDIDVHKPQPQIPKAMPIRERRQIRMEIEKLFDFSDDNKSSQKIVETKQENPISPPTIEAKVNKPEREKMRLSMGSRPAFLDQLRNLRSSQ